MMSSQTWNEWIWSWWSSELVYDANALKANCKQAQIRFNIAREKKKNEVFKLREEIGELSLQDDKDRIMVVKCEMILRIENEVRCYGELDTYLEIIMSKIRLIDTIEFCPNELLESIETVIFASTRITAIPELQKIADLFNAKYGNAFLKRAYHNADGVVSHMVHQNLTSNPTELEKLQYLQQEWPTPERQQRIYDILAANTPVYYSQTPFIMPPSPPSPHQSPTLPHTNLIHENNIYPIGSPPPPRNIPVYSMPPIDWNSENIYPPITTNEKTPEQPSAPFFQEEKQQ
eukprot:TRINITY_DN4772_c0_g1_i1.p1 TRINITY_DN4772_c0_g1~~TRINITY_DN4772_c0_g1_i1.p1  ORF type:complete len:289 (+),score=53.13 TRINITY_DN4772_c0_g1_i1:118-984(+)